MTESVPDLVGIPDDVSPMAIEPILKVMAVSPVRIKANRVRVGSVDAVPLIAGAQAVRALGADSRRTRAQLICDTAWLYYRAGSSTGAPWPANVVCEIKHTDGVFASVVGEEDATLTVISESQD